MLEEHLVSLITAPELIVDVISAPDLLLGVVTAPAVPCRWEHSHQDHEDTCNVEQDAPFRRKISSATATPETARFPAHSGF